MQQTWDIQHNWTCSSNGRTILKQILKKLGVKVQNGDIWLKLEVLWWALQNTTMNLYIPQYTTGLSVTNMQHYRSVSNIVTEQAANECNPYVATATTFTKQYNSSQQEAVMEVCMTVMHSTLKRSWKATKHTHTCYKINNCLFPFQLVSPFHKVTYKEKCLENIPRYRSAISRQLAAPYIHRHQNMFYKQVSLEVTLLQVETW